VIFLLFDNLGPKYIIIEDRAKAHKGHAQLPKVYVIDADEQPIGAARPLASRGSKNRIYGITEYYKRHF
jgi:hypothetical protein